MTLYPVIISFVQTVRGRDFLARVHGDARVIIENAGPDDEWVCAGVQPGGLLETGRNPREAGLSFRHFLGTVLNDLAAEASDIAAFREEAAALIGTVHTKNLQRWLEAVAAFRCGDAKPSDGVEGFARKLAESVRGIQIDTEALPQESLPEFEAAVAVEQLPKAA